MKLIWNRKLLFSVLFCGYQTEDLYLKFVKQGNSKQIKYPIHKDAE
jgi:hypothetical protein